MGSGDPSEGERRLRGGKCGKEERGFAWEVVMAFPTRERIPLVCCNEELRSKYRLHENGWDSNIVKRGSSRCLGKIFLKAFAILLCG